MKKFIRIEPTSSYKHGWRETIIKTFKDDDGNIFEFGTWGAEDRESAAIIALTKDSKVITTFQFRPGPEKWLYELPGGGLEKHESPKEAAVRELAEESGYIAKKVIRLGSSCRDAYMNGKWHYYIAYDCEPLKQGKDLDKEEALQGVQLRLISVDKLIHNAKSGLMTDPFAVLMAYEELIKIQGGLR